jgi:glycosyltransferase involved in cell wall biosynthesis
MSSVDVHILTYNEALILPYALRHYATFARRIIVHDSFSTDATREIARSFGAEVADWDTGDCLNDQLAIDLKDTCWKGTDAHWVITPDADELWYFPQGAERTLAAYEAQGLPMARPHGWNMHSDRLPTTDGQIYDEIRQGAPADDMWLYCKPILFQPALVKHTGFSVGAHNSNTVLRDNTRLPKLTDRPFSSPPSLLLHYKWIGPVEAITKRLRFRMSRLSSVNWQRRWFGEGLRDPAENAAEWVRKVKANLTTVISDAPARARAREPALEEAVR